MTLIMSVLDMLVSTNQKLSKRGQPGNKVMGTKGSGSASVGPTEKLLYSKWLKMLILAMTELYHSLLYIELCEHQD